MLLPVLLLAPLRAVEDLLARRALVPRRLLAHRAGTLVLVKFLDQPHLKIYHKKMSILHAMEIFLVAAC